LTGRLAVYRWVVLGLTALAALAPLTVVVCQSLLGGPLPQAPMALTADTYWSVFADPDFWAAFATTLTIAAGMTAIALPLGAALAFLMVRTDVPGRDWLEPLLLVPIVVSGLILAFGYAIALGPLGIVPLTILAGLIHVSHVYLYAAAALRGIGTEFEDAARVIGAGPWQVAVGVSLPSVWPVLLFAGGLVFFLGVQLFGLVLVLGEPQGVQVLATYLHQLSGKGDGSPYHRMAVVAAMILAATIPLVLARQLLPRGAQRLVFASEDGRRAAPLRLGAWRWPACLAIVLWLEITALVPLAAIALRSFEAPQAFTLDHYRTLLESPDTVRSMINTLGIGVIGGALAVACYAAVALAVHRASSRWRHVLESVVALPRAMPGIVAGLALLWLVLSFKPLAALQDTLAAVWLAYVILWLACGTHLLSGALLPAKPELEEAARVIGANERRLRRDVTLPLMRYGLLASWLIVFIIFVREYATGIYLVGSGNEVIGPLLVSLWHDGAVDLAAALSVVNVLMIGIGLAIAVRAGVRFHG
jgi:iron(III) transport system permease protein